MKMNTDIAESKWINLEIFSTDESFYMVLPYSIGLDHIVHILDGYQRDYDILEEPLGNIVGCLNSKTVAQIQRIQTFFVCVYLYVNVSSLCRTVTLIG